MDAEAQRLAEAREGGVPWRRWGPYLSERQWGTVREDYSLDGSAWESFPHDQARSRAYRWGEDGLLGLSDEKQRLCFALALWNGADPILKERMFGLTNGEGNHGEDLKEYYFYLDSTPTHAYMRALYKYPQRAFPYVDLVQTNRRRSRHEQEYELLDTGVFAEGRYFDVFVEYAKATPEDVLIQVTVHNRGPEAAGLHLLPTLWFRNTWAIETGARRAAAGAVRACAPVTAPAGPASSWRRTPTWGRTTSAARGPSGPPGAPVHGEREQYGAPVRHPQRHAVRQGRVRRLPGAGAPGGRQPRGERDEGGRPLPPDGGPRVEHHRAPAPGRGGGEAAPAGPAGPAGQEGFGSGFEALLEQRRREADAFYAGVIPPAVQGTDSGRVLRQAMAGMLWSKQYYFFDLDRWLEEHEGHPTKALKRLDVRNRNWFHMVNDDVISMPDKWEYPWYAAWDLAFHTVALGMVDLDFAKEQLEVMLRDMYQHPNGQIPAYEWNFGDVNPPVHAWAVLHAFRTERERRGAGDLRFLRHAFHKLLVNFTWWVNRKDPSGAQRLRGGLPGPGQHRGLRPQRPPAHRGHAGAGGRDGLDGYVLPGHAGDGPGAGGRRPPVRGHGPQVLRALPVDRGRNGPHRRSPGRAVGRGGRLLLRRPAPPGRAGPAPQGALDGGAAPDVRHDGGGCRRVRALPAATGAPQALPAHPPRAAGEHRPPRPPRRGGAAPPGGPERDEAAARPELPPGRGGVPQPVWGAGPLPLPRRPPLCAQRPGAGVPGGLPACGVRPPASSGATPTGGARCGSR